jgi:hypothetical protein
LNDHRAEVTDIQAADRGVRDARHFVEQPHQLRTIVLGQRHAPNVATNRDAALCNPGRPCATVARMAPRAKTTVSNKQFREWLRDFRGIRDTRALDVEVRKWCAMKRADRRRRKLAMLNDR